MWTVCVHRIPMKIVPIRPTTSPAFLNAIGIAKIPVPSDPFNKCTNAPKNLQKSAISMYYVNRQLKNVFHLFLDKSRLAVNACTYFLSFFHEYSRIRMLQSPVLIWIVDFFFHISNRQFQFIVSKCSTKMVLGYSREMCVKMLVCCLQGHIILFLEINLVLNA